MSYKSYTIRGGGDILLFTDMTSHMYALIVRLNRFIGWMRTNAEASINSNKVMVSPMAYAWDLRRDLGEECNSLIGQNSRLVDLLKWAKNDKKIS